jgi:peptidoglycan/xylan/chitin deacetylase (PgdA/CDA1 family)
MSSGAPEAAQQAVSTGTVVRVLRPRAAGDGPAARFLRSDAHFHGARRTAVLPDARLVLGLDGAPAVAAPDLPDGPARAEAELALLRRAGAAVEDVPAPVEAGDVVTRYRELGRSAAAVARAAPDLLPELQVGAWWSASPRARAVRRLLLAVRAERLVARVPAPLAVRTAADAAFWRGVREAAAPPEWQRWTRSSYVALCYHRLAGEGRPGQENMDQSPRRFAAQVRALRLLRCHPLTLAEAADFHAGRRRVLPRRSVLLTDDDGFRDAIDPLVRAASRRPVAFVPTGRVGGTNPGPQPPVDPGWDSGGEPLASWQDLRRLVAAGGEVAAHGRLHLRLPELADDDLETELRVPLAELAEHLPGSVPAVAYPEGRYDLRVRAAARRAGYVLGFSTTLGRNGAGTDPWCLARVPVADDDRLGAFLWKVATGEGVPGRLRRLLKRPPARRG